MNTADPQKNIEPVTYPTFTFAERCVRIATRLNAVVIAVLLSCATPSFAGPAALTVSMMPSFSQNPNQGKAALNEPIQVWGRVYGGSGTYTTYSIDYGDGSAVTTGAINSAGVLPQVVAQSGSLAIPAYVGAGHVY